MNYYQGVPTSKISPTERQLNLVIALLNTSTYLTAEEIRQSVAGYDAHNGEAGRQMFERDKQVLKELGIPISVVTTEEKYGVPGYRIHKSDYQLEPMSFTSAERTAINFAMQLYRDKKYDVLQRGFDKLQHDVTESGSASRNSVIGTDREELDKLTTLSEAASQHSTVDFLYHTATNITPERRIVEPWGVVADNGQWYCLGFDRKREAMRVFRLSRMTGPVVDRDEPAHSERPRICARELLRQQLSSVRRYISAEITTDSDISEELSLAADHIETSVARNTEGATEGEERQNILHFTNVNYQWLRDMILANTPHVSVLSPQDLADDVHACLVRIVNRGSHAE